MYQLWIDFMGTPGREHYEYYERLSGDWIFQFILLVMSLGILAGVAVMFFVILGFEALDNLVFGGFAAFWFLLAIHNIILVLSYRALEIKVTGGHLKLRLGFFKTTFPLSSITEVHTGHCRDWPTCIHRLGPGVVVGRGFRGWAVPFRGGVTVHTRKNGKQRLYYVSSKTPDQLKDAIERLHGANKSC